MHEIIPNLYLSGYHKIEVNPNTFVVNCTKNLKMLTLNGVRIAVDDDMSKESINGMAAALPIVVETIHLELQKGNRVVVHCRAGQQRSPTVVAAYLIGKCGYSIQDAIRTVRNKKRDAFFWTINFKESLDRYVQSLNKPPDLL